MQSRLDSNDEIEIVRRLRNNLSEETFLALTLSLTIFGSYCFIDSIKKAYDEPTKSNFLTIATVLNLTRSITAYAISYTSNYVTNRFRLWHTEQRSNEFNTIDDQLSTLTPEEWNRLAAMGLANVDARGVMTPKYLCSISLRLMQTPRIIEVHLANGQPGTEAYDQINIHEYLRRYARTHSALSPLRNVMVRDSNGNVVIKRHPDYQNYLRYLTDLRTALTTFQEERLSVSNHSQRSFNAA